MDGKTTTHPDNIISSNLFISGECCCIPKIPFSGFCEASFDYDLTILKKTGEILFHHYLKKLPKIAESHKSDHDKIVNHS